MKRYRLNVNITEEAAEILKREAERMGTSMGAVVTYWALDKDKEIKALALPVFGQAIIEQLENLKALAAPQVGERQA